MAHLLVHFLALFSSSPLFDSSHAPQNLTGLSVLSAVEKKKRIRGLKSTLAKAQEDLKNLDTKHTKSQTALLCLLKEHAEIDCVNEVRGPLSRFAMWKRQETTEGYALLSCLSVRACACVYRGVIQ